MYDKTLTITFDILRWILWSLKLYVDILVKIQ